MLADKLPSREMILAELEYRATHRIESFYPETGPLRRELYRKHMDFFEAGARHNERLFLGGNRVGKSEGVGAYECVLHLTGKYPAWWRGRRFGHPVAVWAAGKDAKTTRDILQLALLGSGPQFGTGMIPADLILGTTPKPGVPEGVETIYVRHISGGRSEVQLKSYDSGVESFYGTKKHVCWLDEECEPGIYSEVLMRTLSTVARRAKRYRYRHADPFVGHDLARTRLSRGAKGRPEILYAMHLGRGAAPLPGNTRGVVEVHPKLPARREDAWNPATRFRRHL